jgi:hypothetical protein
MPSALSARRSAALAFIWTDFTAGVNEFEDPILAEHLWGRN